MEKYFAKYRSLAGFILLLILPGIFVFLFVKEKEITVTPGNFALENSNESGRILVEISGQVASPGVYELEKDSIVFELVEKAGGFTDSADKYFIAKSLNMARRLQQEEKIYIPQVGESNNASSDFGDVKGKVNINTATIEQLDALPGIGPSIAQKIIDARPFKSINDLKNVPGIGDSKFEDIKDNISV